jgi:enoyl-CoA hydratase/carnithine racemase
VETVSYEVDGGVGVVTLDRPDARNALSSRMVAELAATFRDAAADAAVRALVLTGRPPAFCAGGDLRDLPDGADSEALARRHEAFVDAATALYELDLPTVAAVDGPAIGAGCSLAMLCDIAVAGPGARFGFGFLPLALPPDLFAAAMLQRRTGATVATELLLSGRTVSAEEARSLRLVAFTADDALGEALTQARRLTTLPPFAVAQAKAMLRAAWPPLQAAGAHEASAVGIAASSDAFLAATQRYRDGAAPTIRPAGNPAPRPGG